MNTIQNLLKEYKLPTNYFINNNKLDKNNFIRYNNRIYFKIK